MWINIFLQEDKSDSSVGGEIFDATKVNQQHCLLEYSAQLRLNNIDQVRLVVAIGKLRLFTDEYGKEILV